MLDRTGFLRGPKPAVTRDNYRRGIQRIPLALWGIESAYGDPDVQRSAMRPIFPSLAALVRPKTFAQQEFYTWNVAAPRIGLTYDLSGDGKTVLKGNYGLY